MRNKIFVVAAFVVAIAIALLGIFVSGAMNQKANAATAEAVPAVQARFTCLQDVPNSALYVITDHKTGKEYLAIRGFGVTELK